MTIGPWQHHFIGITSPRAKIGWKNAKLIWILFGERTMRITFFSRLEQLPAVIGFKAELGVVYLRETSRSEPVA